MESSTGRMDAMKPVLVKAGIPVAITVIGYVFAKIASRKHLASQLPSLSEIQENSSQTDAEEMHRDDEQEEGLITLVQDLDTQFLRYQNLKEQEMVLMEHQNKLKLEITRVEFLTREVSLMGVEIQRFGAMVIKYLKIMELLEFYRSENVLLHKRVRKLLRRNREQSHVLKKQNLQIVVKETEISSAQKELEMKVNCIHNMADEIRKLKMAIEQLQSVASKIDGEATIQENYNQLANEVEQLHRDRVADSKEQVYPRWCNACLRHELTRRNTKEDDERDKDQLDMNYMGDGEIEEYGSDGELISGTSRFANDNSCLGLTTGGHAHSKRRKIIAKLKRWVEGSEKIKKKLDHKEQLLAGKSCSSV